MKTLGIIIFFLLSPTLGLACLDALAPWPASGSWLRPYLENTPVSIAEGGKVSITELPSHVQLPPEGARAYRIGGRLEGTVYRIVPYGDGSAPRLVKVYERESSAENALRGFALLADLRDRLGWLPFRLHRILRHRGKTVEFEDVRGQELRSLSRSISLDHEQRKSILEAWARMVKAVHAEIESEAQARSWIVFRNQVFESTGEADIAVRTTSDMEIHLALTIENFVVDADTRELVLVDPF